MSESFTDQTSKALLFWRLLTGVLNVSQNPKMWKGVPQCSCIGKE